MAIIEDCSSNHWPLSLVGLQHHDAWKTILLRIMFVLFFSSEKATLGIGRKRGFILREKKGCLRAFLYAQTYQSLRYFQPRERSSSLCSWAKDPVLMLYTSDERKSILYRLVTW